MASVVRLQSLLRTSMRYGCTRTSFLCPASGYSTDSPVARITMPHKIIERLDKQKTRKAIRTKVYHQGSLIISCRRKKFNHYRGQKTDKMAPTTLASNGWKHYKSVGDYFTINPHGSNPALRVDAHASQYTNFSTLELDPRLVHGLKEQNIHEPTNIQALTIPVMLSGSNVMCTAETGSGKTLAYLLPLLHRIAQYKKLYKDPAMNTPYGILVVPSRELADQIQSVASVLCSYIGCMSVNVCGGRGTQKLIWKTAPHEADLLISTPGVLRKLLVNRAYHQKRLMHIVLDEADTLMDDSFSDLTHNILSTLKITSEKLPGTAELDVGGTQVVLVSATLPTSVQQVLTDIVPMDTIERVSTSHVHYLMPHVAHKFIRVNTLTKLEQFLRIIKSNPHRPTMVFCKDYKTVCFVGYSLEEDGIHNVILHANMPQAIRDGRFEQLQNGETNILVATDVASRGLDTVKVERIINYDLPTHLSDYIHRSGRVGRVGSIHNGTVTNLVHHPHEVEILWKIEAAARSMTKLQGVNANIKRKHIYRHDRMENGALTASNVMMK